MSLEASFQENKLRSSSAEVIYSIFINLLNNISPPKSIESQFIGIKKAW